MVLHRDNILSKITSHKEKKVESKYGGLGRMN